MLITTSTKLTSRNLPPHDGSWSQQDALSFAYGVVHLEHIGTKLLSADELQIRIEIARQGPRQRACPRWDSADIRSSKSTAIWQDAAAARRDL